jgi:hypothetical protein
MSTTSEQPAARKRWLVTGLAAGITLAIVLGGAGAAIVWHASKAKVWGPMGLSATGGEIGVISVAKAEFDGPRQGPVSLVGYRVSYVVRNNSNEDVTLSTASLVKVRDAEGALDELVAPVSFSPTYVPAGYSVRFNVDIHHQLDDIAEGVDAAEFSTALRSRLSLIGLGEKRVTGLVILDPSQHIGLDLPVPQFSKGIRSHFTLSVEEFAHLLGGRLVK